MNDHDKAKGLLRVRLVSAPERIRNSGEAWAEYDAAVIAAHLAALVQQTPEAVVEEAVAVCLGYTKPPRCNDVAENHGPHNCGDCYRLWSWDNDADVVRAALPVLLAPEVARREAAEREVLGWSGRATTAEAEVARLRGEREGLQERIAAVSQGLADGAPAELLLRFTASAFDWNLEETQRAAKMLLKRFYPEATEAVERHRASLASLRASHQEVIRVVREWQEARKAKLDLEDDPAGTHSRTVIERAVEREAEARFALAALDLGGAE